MEPPWKNVHNKKFTQVRCNASHLPKVSIVVLNWNGGDDVVECLTSLRELAYQNYETVVVDNASIDGSPELIRERFLEITLIRNEVNLGFAEGNNVGMRYALDKGTDYVLFLNNDTVVDSRLINNLISVAESNSQIGMVGPKIYFQSKPDTIWFAGGFINWEEGLPVQRGLGEKDGGQFENVQEVDYITGCALLVKKEVIEKIGLMDPRFFLYYEETDWCTRAKRTGFKILFVPQAKVWHKVSVSTGGDETPLVMYYYVRNNMLFLQKNTSIWYRLTHSYRFFREGIAWPIVVAFRRKNPKRWKIVMAVLTGIISFFIRQFGAAPKFIEKM